MQGITHSIEKERLSLIIYAIFFSDNKDKSVHKAQTFFPVNLNCIQPDLDPTIQAFSKEFTTS